MTGKVSMRSGTGPAAAMAAMARQSIADSSVPFFIQADGCLTHQRQQGMSSLLDLHSREPYQSMLLKKDSGGSISELAEQVLLVYTSSILRKWIHYIYLYISERSDHS